MEITEVRISLRDEERLKAFANVTFDNAFVIRGLKVIDGEDGYFVAMPSRKRSDGQHQDIAHPIKREMRDYLEAKVMEAFFAEKEREAGSTATPSPGEPVETV